MYRGHDLSAFERELRQLLSDPHGDMFWMLPMTLIHFVGKDHLTAELKELMRTGWSSYTPYRGDTENHWLMYYASMYLMSQEFPAGDAHEWFNGRSSSENHREAEEYLNHWFRTVIASGLNEFDSPHYLPFYLAPLSLLYGFSTDQRMVHNARSLLDLLIADFAADTLNGVYVGAHSRIYPEPLLERWRNGSTSFSWLLFGNTDFQPDNINIVLDRIGYRPHGAAVYLALSGYSPDRILHAIATDRSAEFTHRERKRTRTRIRRHLPRRKDVYKTVFMHPWYALGSIDGDLVQPVQQHSWELHWVSTTEDRGHNILFCLHPYWSEDEMATFFPEEPELLADRVLNEKKPTYTSEDKWTGGSPYQRIAQHEDALIVLFDIPAGTTHPHIDAYFSRNLEHVTEDPSGWIVARGGNVFVGYYPLCPYEWIAEQGGDRRLRSSELRNGAVVQVASIDEVESLEAFLNLLRLRVPEFDVSEHIQVRYETLRGRDVQFAYGMDLIVDGDTIARADHPVYDGPFINADEEGRITLSGGGETRELSFDFGEARPEEG
ncbi:MAG: hypothetical protein HKN43_03055 [Rhodothermales bacterium]|nr:hypothetical protein [Rhodothermales bacterium]